MLGWWSRWTVPLFPHLHLHDAHQDFAGDEEFDHHDFASDEEFVIIATKVAMETLFPASRLVAVAAVGELAAIIPGHHSKAKQSKAKHPIMVQSRMGGCGL